MIEALHVRQGQLLDVGQHPVGRLAEAILLAVHQLPERLPRQPLGLLFALFHPLQRLCLEPLEVRLPQTGLQQHLAHQCQRLGQLVGQAADGDEIVVLGGRDADAGAGSPCWL